MTKTSIRFYNDREVRAICVESDLLKRVNG